MVRKYNKLNNILGYSRQWILGKCEYIYKRNRNVYYKYLGLIIKYYLYNDVNGVYMNQPILDETNDLIIIRLYVYKSYENLKVNDRINKNFEDIHEAIYNLIIKRNKVFKESNIKNLEDLLSNLLNKRVEIVIKYLAYPYLDSNILGDFFMMRLESTMDYNKSIEEVFSQVNIDSVETYKNYNRSNGTIYKEKSYIFGSKLKNKYINYKNLFKIRSSILTNSLFSSKSDSENFYLKLIEKLESREKLELRENKSYKNQNLKDKNNIENLDKNNSNKIVINRRNMSISRVIQNNNDLILTNKINDFKLINKVDSNNKKKKNKEIILKSKFGKFIQKAEWIKSDYVGYIMSEIKFKFVEGIKLQQRGKYSDGRAVGNRMTYMLGTFNINRKYIDNKQILLRGLYKPNLSISNKQEKKKIGICSMVVKISGY